MKESNLQKGLAEKCVRCGNCQYYCPTFTASKVESFVARGRLELIRAWGDDRKMEYSETFLKRINQCLLCGNCSQYCPAGIETEEIIQAVRTDCAEENKISYGLRAVSENIKTVGNITGDAKENRVLWLKKIEQEIKEVRINKAAEYVYFTGCVPSLYPSAYSIPQAFAKILDKSGVSYSIWGEDEECCGYPLIIGGLLDQAKETAQRNLARLRNMGVKKVITTCASCYHMWGKYYPELLGGDTEIEVIHSTQILAKLVSEGKLKTKRIDKIVTYHDPCDLGRKSGLYSEPRIIMENIEGLILREMKHNREDARCCGGGGNLEMSDSILSGKVAEERIKEAQSTGAEAIVTACQQCKRTLQKGARQIKSRIKVMDICELFLEACD